MAHRSPMWSTWKPGKGWASTSPARRAMWPPISARSSPVSRPPSATILPTGWPMPPPGAAGCAARGVGVPRRRRCPHAQSHRSLVHLGDAADRVFLPGRGRPDEVHSHRPSRECVRDRHRGESPRPRIPLRHRGTEHGHDVGGHRAGYAARRFPADDRLCHLRRIHSDDGKCGGHDADRQRSEPACLQFLIMLAAHDGPETGEDGPTHHGLFWMSLFTAYPGIKVYKPLDANEAVEMLFHAAHRGEPVVFSAVRPGTPVLKRGNGVPPAIEAIHGAYVFKPFRENHKQKLVLAICGGQVMANVLEILPEIEEKADVKIVAVTSPQLYRSEE